MFDTIRQVLETTFQTGATAAAPALAISYPNVPFKQPTGEGAEFCRFTIVGGDGELKSIGRKQREEQFGMVIVQIFTPKNSGTKRSREIADLFAPIFRYKQFRSGEVTITFHQAPRIQDTGDRKDFFQQNLVCPFQSTQIFQVAQTYS